jgi:hypothetical protein
MDFFDQRCYDPAHKSRKYYYSQGADSCAMHISVFSQTYRRSEYRVIIATDRLFVREELPGNMPVKLDELSNHCNHHQTKLLFTRIAPETIKYVRIRRKERNSAPCPMPLPFSLFLMK